MDHDFQYRRCGWVRAGLVGFVLLTCVRVWVGPGAVLPVADAQIPNPAAQRNAAVKEARRTNLLLTEIKQILEVGVLNVRMAGADNPAGAESAPTARRPG